MNIPTTRYLIETEAANYARYSRRTLQRLRQEGTGPRYYQAGRRVLYTREDLDAWLAANARQSTSDHSR